MKMSNQIRDLLKKDDMSITQLAVKLNTSQPNLTNKLLRDSLKISDIQEIANALGYTEMEIVLRRRGEDAIILEDEVIFRPHGVYLQPDKELADKINYNPYKDKILEGTIALRDLVMPVFEANIERIFNAPPDARIPAQLAAYMLEGLTKQLEDTIKDE